MAFTRKLKKIDEELCIIGPLKRAMIAEFVGTFFFLLIGTSANVQVALSDGTLVSVQIAWGIGYAFGLYIALNISGGYLNPSITMTQWMLGVVPLKRFLLLVIAQIIGAFFGAAVAYFGHLDDINSFDGGIRETTGDDATGGLFFSVPSAHISVVGALFDQIIGTAILSSMIWLISDQRRQKIPKMAQPLLISLVMTMIAMTFGLNSGFGINPARDFGSRVFCLIFGYGWDAFSNNNYFFWIPVIGPIIGALIGALAYQFFAIICEEHQPIVCRSEQPVAVIVNEHRTSVYNDHQRQSLVSYKIYDQQRQQPYHSEC